MLQRDYIMKLIQLFFEAVAKFMRNKEGKATDVLYQEVDELYKTFLKFPRNHFHELTVDEIIGSFDDEERLYKVEIVAELFYQDALLTDEIDKQLLRKSLVLFKFVDLHSDTFSITRQRKASEIESLLA